MTLKSTFSIAGSLLMLSSLVLSATAQQVTIQPGGNYYKNPTHSCQGLRVTYKYAYLKADPSLESRTYRIAPQGELLNLVKSAQGYGYMKNGWWLVKSARDRRYWVHQSVATCSNPESQKQSTPTTVTTAGLGKCDSARVTWKYAYLKERPSLSSATYRTAPKGELLKLVKADNGGGYFQNGWWLTASAMDKKHWVHQSVISCAK